MKAKRGEEKKMKRKKKKEKRFQVWKSSFLYGFLYTCMNYEPKPHLYHFLSPV